VELWIADNGTGISEEMLPHVFELFTQERQAIDRARGGLGLGLAIVKNLMTMHSGSVTASSKGRGGGSTFTIRLPTAMGDGAQPGDSQARPNYPRSPQAHFECSLLMTTPTLRKCSKRRGRFAWLR
jgi:hypothetical protein